MDSLLKISFCCQWPKIIGCGSRYWVRIIISIIYPLLLNLDLFTFFRTYSFSSRYHSFASYDLKVYIMEWIGERFSYVGKNLRYHRKILYSVISIFPYFGIPWKVRIIKIAQRAFSSITISINSAKKYFHPFSELFKHVPYLRCTTTWETLKFFRKWHSKMI